MRRWLATSPVVVALAASGCAGNQSAFAPTGIDADRINLLFWIMTLAGGVILLAVMILTALVIARPAWFRRRIANDRFVIGAGIVFPMVTLTVLLTYGLLMMRAGAPLAAGQETLRIAVSGEQWWWRVTYRDSRGQQMESANEIRIPVGRPVALELTTADVIHSFWVPNLAGKLDMIPGRTNVLTLQATEKGISRGQCAEYCGGAHAMMSLHVVALPENEFQDWWLREAAPASGPDYAEQQWGRQVFLESGCGSCHTVRGTPAQGKIGPDLTHVGSRLSLAAATLPNDAEAFARWIRDNQHIKPENRMPGYTIFSVEQLAVLAAYLEGLK
nr:cytochrome c oxidase subunit II [Rhodoligotrophos appendicifer]